MEDWKEKGKTCLFLQEVGSLTWDKDKQFNMMSEVSRYPEPDPDPGL